jgi:hypothetical protein
VVFGLLLAALVVVLLPARQQEDMTAEVNPPVAAKLARCECASRPRCFAAAPDPAANAQVPPAVTVSPVTVQACHGGRCRHL